MSTKAYQSKLQSKIQLILLCLDALSTRVFGRQNESHFRWPMAGHPRFCRDMASRANVNSLQETSNWKRSCVDSSISWAKHQPHTSRHESCRVQLIKYSRASVGFLLSVWSWEFQAWTAWVRIRSCTEHRSQGGYRTMHSNTRTATAATLKRDHWIGFHCPEASVDSYRHRPRNCKALRPH